MKALRNLIQCGDEPSSEQGLDQTLPCRPIPPNLCSVRLRARSLSLPGERKGTWRGEQLAFNPSEMAPSLNRCPPAGYHEELWGRRDAWPSRRLWVSPEATGLR